MSEPPKSINIKSLAEALVSNDMEEKYRLPSVAQIKSGEVSKEGEKGPKGDKGDKGLKGDTGIGFKIKQTYETTTEMRNSLSEWDKDTDSGLFAMIELPSQELDQLRLDLENNRSAALCWPVASTR